MGLAEGSLCGTRGIHRRNQNQDPVRREAYMRAAVLPIAACLISSCARPDYAQPRPDFLILSAGPQPGYAIKRAVDKQKPAILVADDGSVCRTSAERFNGTAAGKWIACDWALPSLDSTDLARAGD
jgi:hypothetical protein